MRKVSKIQQPDQGAGKQPKQPMGLQYREKIPHPEACFNWPLNINVLVR